MNLTTFESREFRLGAVATLTFATASAFGVLPFSSIEVAGFVTGGICVWLLVRENIWNWPVGIANSALYFVVFLQARLFADSVLQLVFVGLGAAGWWYWLFGGAGRGHRTIGRVRLPEAVVLVAVTALATFGLTQYLRSVHDAAPALDSLTTCLSLAATYLQARKFIENWLVWIAADLIYIPLYAWKHLPLTAALYVLFLLMCIRGLFAWRGSMREEVGTGVTTRTAALGTSVQ